MIVPYFNTHTASVPPKHQNNGQRPHALFRLISYNLFPKLYPTIPDMTRDLHRIKDMGFESVWINPFFETCNDMDWIAAHIHEGVRKAGLDKTNIHSRPHSSYAIRSFDIDPIISDNTKIKDPDIRRGKDYEDIKEFTKECKKLDLLCLGDIVLRHVAADHPLIKEKPHLFKKHSNGNFVIFGRDENLSCENDATWDDVIAFDFEDPEIEDEVIETYLRPYCSLMIETFGFEGFRIDSAGEMPRSLYQKIVPMIDEMCMQKHGKRAYLLGETLGIDIKKFMHLDGFMDAVYNSVYFHLKDPHSVWKEGHQDLSHTKGIMQNIAPSIGFPGNHDVPRIADVHQGSDDPIRSTKDSIATVAFLSNGGYFLQYGDEWGIKTRVNVFDSNPAEVSPKARRYDLSSFIKRVNLTLGALPSPGSFEWTQKCFLRDDDAKKDNLAAFYIHLGEGFTGDGHLVLCNTSEANLKVDCKRYNHLLTANGQISTPEKDIPPKCVYLCGDISLTKELTQRLKLHNVRIIRNGIQESGQTLHPHQTYEYV